jgi:subtilisin family serine protease
MSDENVGVIEQYLLNYMTASAALGDAADRLKRYWSESASAAADRAEAAAAGLALEGELQHLRHAHREILAALDRTVPGPFQDLAQQLAQLQGELANVSEGGHSPAAIVNMALRLVNRWRELSGAASSRWVAPASFAEGRNSAIFRAPDIGIASGPFYQPILAELTAPAALPPEHLRWMLANQAEISPVAALAQAGVLKEIGKSALDVVPNPDWKALRERPSTIDPAMEPRLQVALARKKSGSSRMALASTDRDEISVIADVDDVHAWESLSEVKVGITVGPSPQDNARFIVTGRIPIDRIDKVRKQPFVCSLSAAQAVLPTLQATTSDMQVQPGLLPAGVSPGGGAGVVVGIVDFGLDFVHDNFRNADGSTRIESIWIQAGPTTHGQVQYGQLCSRADIDAALGSADPYRTLGYGSLSDPEFLEGTHGTHVTDIAAGNGRGTGVPGCAPESTIIFVDLAATDIAWQGPAAVNQSFGDSVRLLEAVSFIFERAGDRPCVVNLSLGTNGGPHDGTTLVEQGLDRLLRAKPNRAIAMAAANSQDDGIHKEGSVRAGGSEDLVWLTKYSLAGQEMEIWTPQGSRVAAEVIAPDGTSLGVAEPGSNLSIGTDQDVVVYVGNLLDNPGNHDNLIGIFIAGAVGAGQWSIRLHNRGAWEAPFHAWIERLDKAQSSFESPTPGYTLGSISCGQETVCVGSYDAHKAARPLSYFSSTGPTRDGRQKPELSAPGQFVIAARSGSKKGVVRMSGTSMAAPAVTGLIALMLAEAQRQGKDVSSTALRQLLINGINPQGPGGGYWDPGYGFGRACATALLQL